MQSPLRDELQARGYTELAAFRISELLVPVKDGIRRGSPFYWLLMAAAMLGGILIVAAILGDTANYFIGKFFGNRMLSWKLRGKPLVKPKYMEQTHTFYEKYGPLTVIAARFFPIIRTFVPFVAGIGSMNYSRFILFNIIGGVLWITSVSLAGYYLGEIPIVRDNFETVVFGIVGVSIIPIVYGVIRTYFQNRNKSKTA